MDNGDLSSPVSSDHSSFMFASSRLTAQQEKLDILHQILFKALHSCPQLWIKTQNSQMFTHLKIFTHLVSLISRKLGS